MNENMIAVGNKIFQSIVMASVLVAGTISARADPAPGSPAPSAASPAAIIQPVSAASAEPTAAGSGQAPATGPSAALSVGVGQAAQAPTTQATVGKYEDDPVRRGPAAVNAADRPGARGTTGGYDVPRVLASLIAVVGLIFLLRFAGKRFFALPGAHRSSHVVQVLSRSALSPRQQLVLVRVGQRVIVAADNGTQLNPLSEITDPDEVASLIGQLQSEKDRGAFGSSSTRAFSSMFGRSKTDYRAGDPGYESHGDEAAGFDGSADAPFSDEPAGAETSVFAARGSMGADKRGSENVVAATRHELNGLMEKVRLVSDQFGAQ